MLPGRTAKDMEQRWKSKTMIDFRKAEGLSLSCGGSVQRVVGSLTWAPDTGEWDEEQDLELELIHGAAGLSFEDIEVR